MSGEKPREIAVQVLGRRGEHDFTEDLLDRALAGADLPPADRRLCQELVYGIVRWQAALDWLISRKTADRPQKPALRDLLRLGLYQIFWLDRIPNHAAVHVTVELAKHRGFGPQAGFINALLRGYLREFDAAKSSLLELRRSRPALGFSHPEWLVARWQERWGPERTAQLLEWNNTPPKTFARINSLKIDAAKLLPIWREEGVDYDFVQHDWLEENLVFELKSHPTFERMPSFQQGFFYIQDPSTLLAVKELNPQPGETVLDLCAAPGGKLTYIAQRMGNQGRLVAYDTSTERLKLVSENCVRLGVKDVQTVSLAAANGSSLREIPGLKPAGFDRILIDAPCSNTGVMRRRVDLRWRLKREEIVSLRETQRRLIQQASALLKPGGTIVYSTCSLEPEENSQVISAFLQGSPDLMLEYEQELLPFTAKTDGAYVARLKEKTTASKPVFE